MISKNKKIPFLVMEYAEKGTLATFLPLIIGRSQDTLGMQDITLSQNADHSEDVASNLLTIALLSMAAQYAPSEACFYAFDFRSNVDDKRLEHLGKYLSHSVEVIHSRNSWVMGTTTRNPTVKAYSYSI